MKYIYVTFCDFRIKFESMKKYSSFCEFPDLFSLGPLLAGRMDCPPTSLSWTMQFILNSCPGLQTEKRFCAMCMHSWTHSLKMRGRRGHGTLFWCTLRNMAEYALLCYGWFSIFCLLFFPLFQIMVWQSDNLIVCQNIRPEKRFKIMHQKSK